jgi:hypothetical protein
VYTLSYRPKLSLKRADDIESDQAWPRPSVPRFDSKTTSISTGLSTFMMDVAEDGRIPADRN